MASIKGKADIVTFRSTASTILREFYDTRKHSDWEEEKHRIVQTAADLINNDVKCRPVSKDTYIRSLMTCHLWGKKQRISTRNPSPISKDCIL